MSDAKKENTNFSEAELKMIEMIREKAKEDIDFREKLLNNPEEALKEFSEYENEEE